MPYLKPIPGHTGLLHARRYLERDGRAIAHDFINLQAPLAGRTSDGMPEYDDFPWDRAMDETREASGNDVPWNGRRARTYMHFVVSPDPRDSVTLSQLRGLTVRWARECFPDYQVAITYHDDNEGHVPHAHVIVNNTNLVTGRRFQEPDPGLTNGTLQAISREMGLTHFDGRIDLMHPDTRQTGSRTNYQRVHIGRQEAELLAKGRYSWVADIRSRVEVARAIASDERDLIRRLEEMGVRVDVREDGRDWTFSLADAPTRRVSGTRLGADFRRPDVVSELRSPRRAMLVKGSADALAQAASRAIAIDDLSDLKALADAVSVLRETRATSLDDLASCAARARRSGDEESARRIERAAGYVRGKGLPVKAERRHGGKARSRKPASRRHEEGHHEPEPRGRERGPRRRDPR
jgi:hypothetical protein